MFTSMMSSLQKRVLLCLYYYSPRMHRGIVDYACAHNWSLDVAPSGHLAKALRSWQGEGVILDSSREIQALRSHSVKIAVTAASVAKNADCTVTSDDRRIGTIAAEYFLHRGFTNFSLFSGTIRGESFRRRIENNGYQVSPLPQLYPNITARKMAAFRNFLRVLPHPCAVFCENDWEALRVVNTALELGIRVPEEISVLGVGNDDLLCYSSRISLSSIETRLYERGFRLAEALDRLMSGGESGSYLEIEPSSMVIERRSTGFYAIRDSRLLEMIQWLQKKASTSVQIADLAKSFHLSESVIYRKFIANLGISPKQVLLNMRMNIARRLLLDTDEKITAIAADAGFPTPTAFFATFQKIHSCTPQTWRKGNR